MSHVPTILVTGASSGFGRLIVETFLSEGASVFATMRDPAGRNAAAADALRATAAETPGTLHVLELDVTSDASVDRAVAEALRLGGRLDVVVNNAGIGGGGLAETFTVDQLHQIFDINVFGVHRVHRAVLPAMREAGRGLIVNISSVMGRIVIPFAGPYTATKWALEGLSESLRYELAGTGVDVVVVEPGGFGTGFGERMQRPGDPARAAGYGERASLPEAMWGGFVEQLQAEGAPSPQRVADAVLEVVRRPPGERPFRVVVDPMTGGEAPRQLNESAERHQREILKGLGLEDVASGLGRFA